MSTYLEPIYSHNSEALAAYASLCAQSGLDAEQQFDYLLGLYDTERQLLAAGGLVGNTLRGLVAESSHRGEGLMAQVVSGLVSYQAGRGVFRLFLYGKKIYQQLYHSLGFYKLAEAGGKMVFMENSPRAFQDFLANLQTETLSRVETSGWQARLQATKKEGAGGIVMNANPFSLGHLALVKHALAVKPLIHLFILEEDLSLFSFNDRWAMAQAACRELEGVILHKSSSYLISQASFPSYFLKSLDEAAILQAEIDAHIFLEIAETLSIKERFLGSEPASDLTRAYNEVLLKELTTADIKVNVMERIGDASHPFYSASLVRQLLAQGNLTEAKKLVPSTGWPYLEAKLSAGEKR
ncbi:MAG: [citrate (pro-3S)-lyase] ligase [Eubacteriales bacterium]|nr:[citrate (pro-3S)-lyase] ligase [Eubacteriales bacterium]